MELIIYIVFGFMIVLVEYMLHYLNGFYVDKLVSLLLFIK